MNQPYYGPGPGQDPGPGPYIPYEAPPGGVPYGQPPYGQNPYGQGGPAGGYPQPGPYPPYAGPVYVYRVPVRRVGVVQRPVLSPEKQKICARELFFIGLLIGGAFLLYQGLRYLFTRLITLDEGFAALYFGDVDVMYLTDVLFTVFCVGLPFLIVWRLMRLKSLPPRPVIPFGKPYKVGESVLLILGGLGVCLLASVAVNYILIFMDALGFTLRSIDALDESFALPSGWAGYLLMFLRTAILPAIIEELAFRGVILQSLRRYGDWFAIVMSALLFGLMHGNLVQAPFAFAAGLAMGYAAVVTGTLRTSMILHLLNNGVSCLSQIIVGNADSVTGAVGAATLTYGVMFTGLVCLVIYAVKKKNAFRLRPGVYPRAKKRALYFLGAPTLLLAVLWFLFELLVDVQFVGPVFLQ